MAASSSGWGSGAASGAVRIEWRGSSHDQQAGAAGYSGVRQCSRSAVASVPTPALDETSPLAEEVPQNAGTACGQELAAANVERTFARQATTQHAVSRRRWAANFRLETRPGRAWRGRGR